MDSPSLGVAPSPDLDPAQVRDTGTADGGLGGNGSADSRSGPGSTTNEAAAVKSAAAKRTAKRAGSSAPPISAPPPTRKQRKVPAASPVSGTQQGLDNPVAAQSEANEPPAASQAASGAASPAQVAPTSPAAPGGPDRPPAVVEEEPISSAPAAAGAAGEAQRLQRDLATLRDQYSHQKRRVHFLQTDRVMARKVLCSVLVQVAKGEANEERDRLASERFKLGHCKQVMLPRQDWIGGYMAEEVQLKKERISSDKSAVDRLRRLLRSGRANAKAAAGDDATGGGGSGDEADAPDQNDESREILNYRVAFLNKEIDAVKDKEQRLQVERALYQKRLQKMEAAERSNFRNYPCLSDEHYQLLNMIGRGGFSEVFRAYDLEANRFCAVKIHELGKEMSDTQRQSYIRRAMREYEIQKTLKHPRVVNLLDCFPISTKAFGTVLELVEGETLDEHMKRYGPLGEKEARGIIIQILSGLKYMNTAPRKIIHYDIKPSNIFFHYGEVKIADFGLSKMVQDQQGRESIDLTSQGAGTYWYLPPECFVSAHQSEPPKISNKVDVWSTGVIFFELLFARRPFGHGRSQEELFKSTFGTASPFAVDIPSLPKVSPDAKGFLQRLLTENRENRPDVHEAYSDVYLRSKSRPSAAGPVAAVGPPCTGAGGSMAGAAAVPSLPPPVGN